MQISKLQCVQLLKVLDNTEYDFPIDSQYRYFITKNLDILKGNSNLFTFQISKDVIDGYEQFQKLRQSTIEKFGIDHMAKFEELSEENKTKLTAEMNLLNDENRSIINENLGLAVRKKEFFSELIDLPLRTIHISKVPNISKKHENTHWAIWNTLKLLIEE